MKPGVNQNIRTLLIRIKGKFRFTDDMQTSRFNIALSTYSNAAAGNLIGGNFLIGLLLLLNADDAFIGLITIISYLGNLFQIFSPVLLERFPSRKKLLIYFRLGIYVFNIILIGIVPWLGFTDASKLTLILVFLLFLNLVNAISAPGFSIWTIKNIPNEVRAGFFSVISVTNTVFVYAIILLASKIADDFKASGNALLGLSVLRIAGVIFALLDIYFLTKVKEHPYENDGMPMKLSNIFLIPLKEKKYLLTILIACLWTFSASIPGQFFSIYLLKEVKVSYSYLNIINMINIPIIIFLTPLWARRIRKTSWFGTLSIAMGFYLIAFIGLSFVTKETLFLFPIFQTVAFVFAPGINLAFMNIPYINMPPKNQTYFIGFYAAIVNFTALIASIMSRQFIIMTSEIRINLFGIHMQNKQYILLIAAFIMLVSTIVIYNVKNKVQET